MHAALPALLLLSAASAGVSAALLPDRVVHALAPRQTQDTASPLYLNEPSCDFYQCAVTVQPGSSLTANWLNPPSGDVALDLMSDAGATLAHHIATVPGTSQQGYCDAGYGVGVVVDGKTCGRFSFIVPSGWEGNYTMRASSVLNQAIQSYTDVILITSNASTPSNVAFATSAISGAPTSTVFGQGSGETNTYAPTAATAPGAAVPSSSAAASSAASGSSANASASANGTSTRASASGSSSSAAPAASQSGKNAARLSFAPSSVAVAALGAGLAVAALL